MLEFVIFRFILFFIIVSHFSHFYHQLVWIAFWFKKLHFYRDRLTELYQNTYEGNDALPLWLTEAKTTLIVKNKQTENAKNYRPIACLILTYKIYTSCLSIFLTDHSDLNNIITLEQAAWGCKEGVWGCVEQLLLNKAVMLEVKKKRRDIFTVWLDYKKVLIQFLKNGYCMHYNLQKYQYS